MNRPIARLFAIISVMTFLSGGTGALLAGEVVDKAPAGPGSRIVLFSQPYCPGCEAAKYYFHNHEIPYLEFDITASRAARDTFERLGGRGTPFFVIGGRRMHGFSVPRIEQRLKELGVTGDES